ncbi:hypothetical protein DIE23_37390 [Burkholderia sp. Bp9143]|nr:hypothetical protein DIE23_37390 [Burkholderia sp. Bp9143]
MAESFVKTMKRDYVSCMPKPDARTALPSLAITSDHYNEKHPQSALKYRSPRGIHQPANSNPSVTACPAIRRHVRMPSSDSRRSVATCHRPICIDGRALRLLFLTSCSTLPCPTTGRPPAP